MKIIKPVKGKHPQISKDCFIAENATIVGDVTMGDQCSVWFSAVIRGDVNSIVMGNKVNIQDGAVIHCTFEKTKGIRCKRVHHRKNNPNRDFVPPSPWHPKCMPFAK